MKTLKLLALLTFFSLNLFGQTLISGQYDYGMYISFDEDTKNITGYFENYTGWDEESKNHRFSCIFYFEGKLNQKKIEINSFYPLDKNEDQIKGTLEILNNKTLKIKLVEEHGGCWNVQHFIDEPVTFKLTKQIQYKKIGYIENEKTYFYKEPNSTSKQKSYLIKGDIVCVTKVKDDWAYITYYGKKTSTGWIKINDIK